MSASNELELSPEYRAKFPAFIRMVEEAKEKGIEAVAVAWPRALGDNYDEVITSLGLLAKHELYLRVVAATLP